ncbi:MAG TPA: hypothetical protein VJ837_06190 [Candidatus Paceibacterota bacterium]|nr:hypothetical protein [Candidatus Paceibacterota bacterium]
MQLAGHDVLKDRAYGEVRGIRVPSLKLSFRWNGQHTINIFLFHGKGKGNRTEVDVMSIGSFADDHATEEEFVRAVTTYLEEKRYEDVIAHA